MTHPLYVAFIWHHHQPYYRQPGRDLYILPWVRVHAAKDYLHMAEVLRAFPQVKATFNLVPALIEQLEAYAQGRAEDPMTFLGYKDRWTEEEKQLILNLGFSIHWQRLAFRFPRYRELISRRDTVLRDPEAFTDQDYLDLIALFNLAWTDARSIREVPALQALAEKGQQFTPEDIHAIVSVHRQLCGRTLEAYTALAERGQIELLFSPYYHPILPLLMNTDHARRATPDIQLPTPPFTAAEDARTQLVRGKALCERVFGRPITGAWPSEQAVSPETAALLTEVGARWFVSDEAVLGRSLDHYFHRDSQEMVQTPHLLYRPYRVRTPQGSVYAVFRDHTLSDKIGFVYMHYPPKQAAEDLLNRLLAIRERLNDPQRPYLVVIALDGENAWEHYEDNGTPFLEHLYRGLSEHPHLETITVSEFLERFPETDDLPSLATGSWINGDLTTWIGDPEHTVAWTLLRQTREALIRRAEAWRHNHEREAALQQAWTHLLIAEGSDWFWWYSRRNTSAQDHLFDALFRENLMAVHRALGESVPLTLEHPVPSQITKAPEPLAPPYFTPRLTAEPSPLPDWAMAHVIRPRLSTGTMQAAQAPIQAMRVGYDQKHLYVRLELSAPVPQDIVISLTGPAGALGEVTVPPVGTPSFWRYAHPADIPLRWRRRQHVVEIALPLDALGLYSGDTVGIRAGLFEQGELRHALPPDMPYYLVLELPDEQAD